jgi:hypothetical protein
VCLYRFSSLAPASLSIKGLVLANPVSGVVGVRNPSYASANMAYRFGMKAER